MNLLILVLFYIFFTPFLHSSLQEDNENLQPALNDNEFTFSGRKIYLVVSNEKVVPQCNLDLHSINY